MVSEMLRALFRKEEKGRGVIADFKLVDCQDYSSIRLGGTWVSSISAPAKMTKVEAILAERQGSIDEVVSYELDSGNCPHIGDILVKYEVYFIGLPVTRYEVFKWY